MGKFYRKIMLQARIDAELQKILKTLPDDCKKLVFVHMWFFSVYFMYIRYKDKYIVK